jgi:hypothetical protein
MKQEESQPNPLPAPGTESGTWISGVEAYTREQPTRAVSAAFGAGLILALVPIGGIVRLLFSALRPVLVILGIVKIWEEVEARQNAKSPPLQTRSSE